MISCGSARPPCAARPGPRGGTAAGEVRFSLGSGRATGGGAALARRARRPRRAALGAAACRFVSRFIAMAGLSDVGVGQCDEQGRRDSNPQPPVLETGALPIELLPYGGSPMRALQDSLRAAATRHAARCRRPQPGSARPAADARRRAREANTMRRRRRRRWRRRCRRRRRPGGRPAATARRGARRPPRGVARISASRPGAGSSTSVRRLCSARSSLRYWTSSAWHRRQCSTWRRSDRSSIDRARRPRRRAARPSSSHRTGVVLLDRRRPPRQGNSRSRSLRRARCSRTLAADSEMPSSAAMASWGRS